MTASDRAYKLIAMVKESLPSLELHDVVPLLPEQYGVRWGGGQRRYRKARAVLRDEEQCVELFCDRIGDRFGHEELLTMAQAAKRIVAWGKALGLTPVARVK